MTNESVTVSARISTKTQKQVLDLCERSGISSNAFFRELIESTISDPDRMAIHSIATKDEQAAPRYGYIRALLKVANMYGQHLTDEENQALKNALTITSGIFEKQMTDFVKNLNH